MSHILNLVTEIAETNQAKAIDAKFAKTRENSELQWKQIIFEILKISRFATNFCCLIDLRVDSGHVLFVEYLMTDYVLALQKLQGKDMYHQFVCLCGELWIRPWSQGQEGWVKLDKGKSMLGGPLSYLFCQMSLEFNLEKLG